MPLPGACTPFLIVRDNKININGSGTTGLVAQQLGRNYIGIELNPEYVKNSRATDVG